MIYDLRTVEGISWIHDEVCVLLRLFIHFVNISTILNEYLTNYFFLIIIMTKFYIWILNLTELQLKKKNVHRAEIGNTIISDTNVVNERLEQKNRKKNMVLFLVSCLSVETL